MLGPTPREARFVTLSTLRHVSSHPAPVAFSRVRSVLRARNSHTHTFCAANTLGTHISKLARRSGILQTIVRTLASGRRQGSLNGPIHPGRLFKGWLKQVRNIMAADEEVETDEVSPGSMVLETETQ